MVSTFKQFILYKENIDIISIQDDSSRTSETERVVNFDWSPYNVEILTCVADIEETKSHVTIKITNGDLITFHGHESRSGGFQYRCEINHQSIDEDAKEALLNVYIGSTGSLVADILLYYKQEILSKR